MQSDKEIKIVELLSQNKLFSITKVAKDLGLAYSHAHLLINRLNKQGIIKKQNIGKTIICELDYLHPLTILTLAKNSYKVTQEFIKKDKRSEKLYEKIQRIKEDVEIVLLQNHKIILVTEKEKKFKEFKNRKIITITNFKKNKNFYEKAIILYGAEKYWSVLTNA